MKNQGKKKWPKQPNKRGNPKHYDPPEMQEVYAK
jgi:hypothetical protein